MNRETLKTLGLSDEQIDSVMKEHGKTLYHHDIDPASMGSISDLFDGATKNQLRINLRHDKTYWEGSANVKKNLKFKGKQLLNIEM